MKKLKGFTLIELLIVIAIIGILAVALLPNILSAPASARDVAKKSAVENVIVAIEQYNSTNGSLPTVKSCIIGAATGSGDTTEKVLQAYFKGGVAPKLDHITNVTVGDVATCAGIVYCPLAGDRYFVGVGLEKTGTGTGYYDSTNDACGTTKAVVNFTNPPTASTALWGIIQ